MAKSINTLISDIYSFIKGKEEVIINLESKIGNREERNTLRLSGMGPKCPCALWHSIHHPEKAEPLPPWAIIKYSFGHMIEAQTVALARAAGHSVEGVQDELKLDDIVGHRDCVIDGCTVDVKSAATISFNNYRAGRVSDNFGYLSQLDGYVLAAKNDPLVTVKDKGYLLFVDKQLGHMYLHEHHVTPERELVLRDRLLDYKRIVLLNIPPLCKCGTERMGESGNVKLDTQASYSPYKYCCFPHLRTFLYSGKPVYLSTVIRKPGGDVKEIDRNGKTIYN